MFTKGRLRTLGGRFAHSVPARVVLLIIMFSAILAWRDNVALAPTADMSTSEMEILNAAARRRLVGIETKGKLNLFVSIGRENPPPEFLDRLGDLNASFNLGSQYRTGRGVLLTLRLVSRPNDNHAEVEVGFYYADEGAVTRYILTRTNGAWTITTEVLVSVT